MCGAKRSRCPVGHRAAEAVYVQVRRAAGAWRKDWRGECFPDDRVSSAIDSATRFTIGIAENGRLPRLRPINDGVLYIEQPRRGLLPKGHYAPAVRSRL